MTITNKEAAEAVALRVRVQWRKHNTTIWPDRNLVEEIVSELRGGHAGQYLKDCADRVNCNTVLRKVIKDLNANGELD